MKCVSALSTVRNTEAALREVLARASEGMSGQAADLAFVFTSPHHADELKAIAAAITDRGLGRHVLGCTGESIVGEGQEVEGAAGLSLWAIALPGAELTPVRLEVEDGAVAGWPEALNRPAPDPRALLLLADPFHFPMEPWLRALREASPGLRVCGGMASGGMIPGQNRLVLDGAVHKGGGVGIVVDGPLAIRTVVSQGCRPIGRPLIVTEVDRNILRSLGRRPAMEVLRELFEGLDPADQEKVQQGLHIGRVISEYRESFGRGDFLVRNVMGADEAGGIAIGDLVRVGQTVQFHVRDAETADEDLRTLLAPRAGSGAAGALLFTCNGRGTCLFPGADHDVSTIRDVLGPIPVGGFFAMGELGPVGDQNFVHGYTASVVLFEPA